MMSFEPSPLFSQRFRQYRLLVDDRLQRMTAGRGPASLYDPVAYILDGAGKRIRAVLAMLAADAVGGDGAAIVDAAAAVETLHNFTLVHDDIMDRADTRRGRETIHRRWDEGTAILAGDVMVGLAYEALLHSALPQKLEIMDAMTRGIVDVSEGQSLDCEYARRADVTLDDYLRMITMKTARLLETAAEVGALAAGAAPREVAALCAYGRGIGLAFQIQDDLLDITANEAELGKRIGGDIIEGKRTWLLVTALDTVRDGADRELLERLLAGPGLPESEVPAMRSLFERHGIIDAARSGVREYHERAVEELRSLPDGEPRQFLEELAQVLMRRTA